MKKVLMVAALLAAVAFVPQTASAATIFTFTFAGDIANGSGWISGDLIPGTTTTYGITAGNLNVAGGSYPGVYDLVTSPAPWNSFSIPAAPGWNWTGDDLFDSITPHFTFNGLLFHAGAVGVNIWADGGEFYYGISDVYLHYGQLDSFTVREQTSVPEPATISLLGLGMVGVARAARRKKK